MDVWFAGESALEVIRRVRLSEGLFLEPVDVESLDPAEFKAERGELRRLNFLAMGLSRAPSEDHPASIRLPKASDRRKGDALRCHVFPKNLPKRGVLQLKLRVKAPQDSHEPDTVGVRGSRQAPGAPAQETVVELFGGRRVFVDSVALVCASEALRYQTLMREGKLTEGDAVVRLVELVMELAGYYGRDPADPRAGSVTENIASCASVEEIGLQIGSTCYLRGARLLAKALAYARNGARSPMETCLWIMLMLPEAYGLYGMVGAKLNSAVVPTEAQRAMMRHRTLTPDILWEGVGTAVEYQGLDEHSSRAARVEDARRLNDYLVCGIRAHFVCFDDIRTPRGLDKLVLEIAQSMAANGFPGELKRLSAFVEDEEAGTVRAGHLSYLLPPVER